MINSTAEITDIVARLRSGDPDASGQLLAAVYADLRRLAAAKMAREVPGHTLQATALVHEAWLRLGAEDQSWENRAHFFGAAAEAMRRILIESARRKKAGRHGGGLERIDPAEIEIACESRDHDLLALDEALEKLAALDAQKAELVKLRYFVGLTIEEAAAVLAISPRTARRHWTFARAWLHDTIRGSR